MIGRNMIAFFVLSAALAFGSSCKGHRTKDGEAGMNRFDQRRLMFSYDRIDYFPNR